MGLWQAVHLTRRADRAPGRAARRRGRRPGPHARPAHPQGATVRRAKRQDRRRGTAGLTGHGCRQAAAGSARNPREGLGERALPGPAGGELQGPAPALPHLAPGPVRGCQAEAGERAQVEQPRHRGRPAVVVGDRADDAAGPPTRTARVVRPGVGLASVARRSRRRRPGVDDDRLAVGERVPARSGNESALRSVESTGPPSTPPASTSASATPAATSATPSPPNTSQRRVGRRGIAIAASAAVAGVAKELLRCPGLRPEPVAPSGQSGRHARLTPAPVGRASG